MGNKLGLKRQVVDDKYTKPQGLYELKDVDQKKLRKLILHSKLAPCYPGDDESGYDLEECPICFLYYPSLNRSRCCTKGICTECFLQMRTPNSTRPTQCPFCKTLNYGVEYRGVRTKEEKSLEQIEEQRVIEAKMRIRKQELQNEEERMLKRSEISYSHSMRRPSDVDCCSTAAERSTSSAIQGEEVVTSDESQVALAVTPPSCSGQHREDMVDVDLEDIMVMEAIWLSIKDKGVEEHDPRNTAPSSSSSSSQSLAHAIAMIVDRQQEGRETSNDYGENSSAYNVPEQEPGHYVPAGSSIGALTDSHRPTETEVAEELTEVGTGCADCDDFDDSISQVERPAPPYSLLKRL